MEVAGTGAPVVAAAGVGIIASVDVLLSLTAQQLRELIAAGLIALSKEVGVASKAPSLPTQSRQAIQRIIQEIKSSSKMQPPSVTRKLPVAITGGIISSEEMYCRELQ